MQSHRIYFDNAATTALSSEVLAAMMPYLTDKFGNPSSVYSYGRETRLSVENARKTVAKLLGAHPGEIFFTSCGTESTNTAIHAAVRNLGCTHIITSPLEHHATLHTTEYVAELTGALLSHVKVTDKGHLDLAHLETLLQNHNAGRAVVSLMHANNEIGNLLDLHAVSELCKRYDAIFHTDTVQTVGHYPFNVSDMNIHFLNGSAHKFHGPKGVGILYINKALSIKPFINGGSQERNMRAGTENIYGIVGFAKALELAMEHYKKDSDYIQGIKSYMAQQLTAHFPDVSFNGDALGNSLYTVLNVAFLQSEKSDMLLFNLDMQGVCVSGGSACTSGANSVSHVIQSLYPQNYANIVPIRFSFSKYNTIAEVDKVIAILKEVL
ncbi:MAG: cysteine desulfurase [Chitinophagia bacterium]|nr:cysteine desulfurase [Chitinophagia bacterium]